MSLSTLFFLLASTQAQPIFEVRSSPSSVEELIIDKRYLYTLTDSSCTLNKQEALAGDWTAASAQYFSEDTKSCQWLKMRIQVFADSNVQRPKHHFLPFETFIAVNFNWLLEAGHHGLNTMYIFSDGVLVDSTTMGNDLPLNQRAYPRVWSQSYLNITPLNIQDGVIYDLVFKYSNLNGQSLYGTNDRLAITLIPTKVVERDSRLHLLFTGLMMGGLLLLFLYQLTQWVVYRTELGITYCFMLLGLMSYIMYDDFLLHAIFANHRVSELWLFVTGSLGLLGFFRFAQLTLKAVDFVPHRDRVLGILFKVKLVEVLVYFVLALFADSLWSSQLAAFVPETFRLLLMATLLGLSWVVISHFRENRDVATRAFMLGNLSLVAGVMVVTTQAYILPFADIAPVRWYLQLIWPAFDYIIEAGIVGMALCFALAVARLTKERENKVERAYNRRLVDVEMKALRSQMNPHFLFNGLNSIKSFVIDNRRHEAADYLTKFSRLIRLVLENSKASLIPLSKEIETLGYYLEMESMRFDGRFSYEINVADNVNINEIQVPPTLIQPFVENSIWHGLLPKKGEEGFVIISIGYVDRTLLQIIIEDNGIGRAASEARRMNLPNKRKSLGMEITTERIAMLKELYGFSATLEFVDLKNEFGVATGTRVVISIDQL